jgi:predicted DNA-binding transcriptional regulator AlpA
MRKFRAKKNTEAVAPELTDTPVRSGQRDLLSKSQMLALLGDPAYSTVWGWMRAGTFPLPIELGPPNSRSTMIAWYADEIHDWIANRPRRKIGQRLHEFRGRDADKRELKQAGR